MPLEVPRNEEKLEEILAHCSNAVFGSYPLLVSVALGGIVGSVGHCSVMCAPLAAAHMLALKEQKKSQSHMVFYHAGRVSSYMLLGALAALAGTWLFNQGLTGLSRYLLLAAGTLFVASAVFPAKTHRCCPKPMQSLQSRLGRFCGVRLQYYIRGALMGFMPCGMLWSALFVAGSAPVATGVAVMLVFGLSTIPMLQLIGAGVLSLSRRYPQTGARAGRFAMVVNGMFLCGIGLNLVHVN